MTATDVQPEASTSRIEATESLVPPLSPPRRAKSLPSRTQRVVEDYPPPRRASTGARPVVASAEPDLLGAPATALPPALQVRASLLRRVAVGFSGLGGDTRFALALKLFLVIGQLISFSVVLGLTHGESCDKPLRTYLIVHIIRATVSYPLGFYASLLPPAPPRNEEDDTPERRAAREARRVIGTPRWDARVKLASDLLLIFAIVWFVIGNVWEYTSETCRDDSPGIFFSTLASLIIGYFYLAEVVLIVFAIVFFLPLAVLILSALLTPLKKATNERPEAAMGYGGKKNAVGPLSQQGIDAIPIVLFMPAAEGQAEAIDEVADKPEADTKPVESVKSKPARRARWSRLLFPKKTKQTKRLNAQSANKSSAKALPYPLHALPENQATCSICLVDYETPPPVDADATSEPEYDLLRLLPACRHAFHKDCLDTWLKTSGRCPLCQLPVKAVSGKKRQQSESDEPTNDHDEAVRPAEVV